MAMYDIIGEFSDGQAYTSLTSSQGVISDNIINLGVSDVNWGNGEIWLNIKVHTAFVATASTPATTIVLYSATDTTIDSGDTAIISIASQNLTSLSIGDYVYRGRLPIAVDPEQYLGVYFQNATDSYSAGALDIWLDHGSQSDFATQKAQSNIT